MLDQTSLIILLLTLGISARMAGLTAIYHCLGFVAVSILTIQSAYKDGLTSLVLLIGSLTILLPMSILFLTHIAHFVRTRQIEKQTGIVFDYPLYKPTLRDIYSFILAIDLSPKKKPLS